eukprot:2674971-Rhodomonas_salina.1
MSAHTGRNVSAAYVSAPIVIVAPQAADPYSPGGTTGDGGFPVEDDENLVEPGSEGSGLSLTTILVVMAGTLGGGM